MKKLLLFSLLFLYHTPALGEDVFGNAVYPLTERVSPVKPVTIAPIRTGHRRWLNPSRFKIEPHKGPVTKPVVDARAPLKLPEGAVKPRSVQYQFPLTMVGLIQYHKDWFIPVIPVEVRPLPPIFETPLKAVVTVIGGACIAVLFASWCFVRRDQIGPFFKGAWNVYYDAVEYVADTVAHSCRVAAARGKELAWRFSQGSEQSHAAESYQRSAARLAHARRSGYADDLAALRHALANSDDARSEGGVRSEANACPAFICRS